MDGGGNVHRALRRNDDYKCIVALEKEKSNGRNKEI
jgi:hypothetical protein